MSLWHRITKWLRWSRKPKRNPICGQLDCPAEYYHIHYAGTGGVI